MLKRFLTKLGLGTALLAGCALLPAAASAQTPNAHLETVDHHGGRGWGGGHWDRGRGWHGGGWRGYGYPAYGGGLGLGFYLGTAPSYNYYYGAPAYPAPPAYPPNGAYAAPSYPPPASYGTPGYPPANSYPPQSYPQSY